MAQIREELILYDRFTNTFTSYIRQADQASGATNAAQKATKEFAQSQEVAARSTSALTDKIKGLVGAYLGVQTLKGLASLSDTMTSTTARLDMMNDGLQTTEELNEMIYQSAMRSRGAYTETAAFVAKLGNLAGGAFDSSAEIVAFAEQINKQMVLSGTTSQEAQAAMLQLTQGLSSGALRGEELNSVLEQTPMIAKTIAEYMGVTTGEMRELASEGKVTADVVKNAMFEAAEETDVKFAQMPMTWGQVWTQMKNVAIKALGPVLNAVNWLANNIDEGLNWISEHADGVAAVLAGLGAIALVVGAQMVGSAAASAIAWAAVHWPILLVGAAVAALIYAALKAGATFEEIGGVIGGVFGMLYASAMNNAIIPLQRGFAAIANFIGNVFNHPVEAIQILFFDMVLSILGRVQSLAKGIQDLVNMIPGVEVNLASGLDKLIGQISGARQSVMESSGYKEYVTPWDYVNYGEAWGQGSALGSKLGSAIENFNLGETLGGFGIGGMAYDELTSQVSDIAQSVNGIEKSVSMSEEDIKSLVDMAERQYVTNVNLTSRSPVININGQNTGNTAADTRFMESVLMKMLGEQTASTSLKSTAKAF